MTDQYASRGVVFAGFGQNAGGLVNPDFGQPPPPWFSPPNIVYFVSIFPVATGGLAQSPETLSFYPPVTSFQFDSSSLNVDCAGTSVVTVRAFAPGGTLLGTVSVPVTPDGQTLAMTFPAPGAEKVVVSSSHTCGPPGTLFNGVEVFSMDNVAFVSSSLGVASKCAQSAIDAAGKKAKAEASCNAKALQNGVPVDPACIQKAVDNFNKGFAKAQAAGDCQTDADVATVESSVDTLIVERHPAGDQRLTGSGRLLRQEADGDRQEGPEHHQVLLEGGEEWRDRRRGVRREGGELLQLVAQEVRHPDPARAGRGADRSVRHVAQP